MKRALLALLAVFTVTAGVEGATARLYAVSDGDRIERDALSGAIAPTGSVWDRRKVHLFGARNEILAFQVIVESDERGIAALSAGFPELRQRGGVHRTIVRNQSERPPPGPSRFPLCTRGCAIGGIEAGDGTSSR